jgi:hypothetical protein
MRKTVLALPRCIAPLARILSPNYDVEKEASVHPAVNQLEIQADVPLVAQSDRLANAPQSGHPDAGGIYHITSA